MKLFVSLFLFLFVSLTTVEASVVGGSSFSKVIHLSADVTTSAKSAANDGRDYSSAKGFLDGDLIAIPKNVIIENIYTVIDETVVGLTAFNIGDDDAATGFIVSASPTLAAGLKYYEVDYKGSYLKGGGLHTTSMNGKLYTATGKKVKLDVTGTASAGKMRVFIKGYAVGAAQ